MSRSLVARCLLLLVALTLGGSVHAARNRPRHERRASLVVLLGATQAELARATLDQLGPDTEEMLIDIANTPRERSLVRMRALAGLAYYPSEASYAYLSSLLNERNLMDPGDGLRLRRQAMRSIGMGFGERGVDELLTFKNDPQPALREAVALALGDSGSERALPTLELWLTTEQDLMVRTAVDRAVDQLRGR